MWFFALNYATGPGHADHVDKNGARVNPKGKPYLDPLFRQPTAVPDTLESHGGEDVGVYASGPYSHVSSNEPMVIIIQNSSFLLQLFTGVYEQNYLHHAMAYATCLGPKEYLKNPHCTDGATVNKMSPMFILTAFGLSAVIAIVMGGHQYWN